MIALRHLCLLAVLAVVATAAAAEEAPVAAGVQVYQLRLADGRIMLTDRPVGDAQTERTWQIAREDADVARQRSARMHLEAEAIAERIRRRLDRQQLRGDEFELARLRASLAEARRDAEIARYNAGETAVLFVPRPLFRPIHQRLPRHALPPGMSRRGIDGHRPEAF